MRVLDYKPGLAARLMSEHPRGLYNGLHGGNTTRQRHRDAPFVATPLILAEMT